MRMMTSVSPPGVKGTTKRIWDGGESDCDSAEKGSARTKRKMKNRSFTVISLRNVDPQIEHHDRAGNAECGHLDRRKGQVLLGQVLVLRLPGALEVGEAGVELLRAHRVGEGGAGLATQALGAGEDMLHLRPHV